MPIATDNSLLSDVNQTIQTTANLNTGTQTANAAANAGNIISGIGTNWSQKYGSAYGHEQAIKQITEQIDKGANGDFSHVANFTPYGEEYNKVMDQVAPNVISADMNQQLQLMANKVRTDPRIPAEEKVAHLSKLTTEILDKTIPTIAPEWQNQVKLNVAMQGLDEQNKMVQTVAEVQTAQQFLGVKDAIDKAFNLAASAQSVEAAMNSYDSAKQLLDAALGSNAYTLSQFQATLDDGRNKVALAQMGTHGYEALKKWNDSSKMFTEQEMQQYQHMNDVVYQQKQQAIELNQRRNHINFEASMMSYLDGSGNMYDGEMTDQQAILKAQAPMAKKLYQAAAHMGEAQQEKLKSSAAFNSLPSEWKSMISSNLAKIVQRRATGDISDYGMDENTPFDQRLAAAQQFGISPDKLLTKKEQNQIRIAYINGDRQQVYQALVKQTNPQFADYYTKKFAGDPDSPMPAMLNPYAKRDDSYMLGSASKNTTGKTPTQKNAPTMYKALTIENMPTATKMAVYDHILQVTKGEPLANPEDLFNARYSVINNGVVIKGHDKLVTSQNAESIARKISKDKKEQLKIQHSIENGSIYPDFQANAYIANDKKGLKVSIPFSVVDQLPNDSSNKAIDTVTGKRIVQGAVGAVTKPYNFVSNLLHGDGEDE